MKIECEQELVLDMDSELGGKTPIELSSVCKAKITVPKTITFFFYFLMILYH